MVKKKTMLFQGCQHKVFKMCILIIKNMYFHVKMCIFKNKISYSLSFMIKNFSTFCDKEMCIRVFRVKMDTQNVD